MIWKVAEFCGVNVITYAIMPNHFHVLLRVPLREAVSDEELIRRYLILHPKPTPFQTARIEVIRSWLARNTPEGTAWREQQLALMFDLSAYMKLLKQRFTHWYNAVHKRFGTLWAERFKSILVQFDGSTLLTIAAYIDLNAVRKGLVRDPADYPFCGYTEAVSGHKPARRGLHLICPQPTWNKTQAEYRRLLYSVGATPRANKHQIDDASFRATLANQGELPLASLLRHRWRHFSEGSILGSALFVATQKTRLLNRSPQSTTSVNAPSSQPTRSNTTSRSSLTTSTTRSHSAPSLTPPPPHKTLPALPSPWSGLVTAHRINRRRLT